MTDLAAILIVVGLAIATVIVGWAVVAGGTRPPTPATCKHVDQWGIDTLEEDTDPCDPTRVRVCRLCGTEWYAPREDRNV